MNTQIVIPLTIYDLMRRSLFPAGSPDEQFGFALAGVSRYARQCRLLVRQFIAADPSCSLDRSRVSVRPDPRFTTYVWILAQRSGCTLIDVHTHPFADERVTFSSIDDASDRESFPKAVAFLGAGPHASMVLGQSSLDARWYDAQAKRSKPVAAIRIIGPRLETILPTSVLLGRESDPKE